MNPELEAAVDPVPDTIPAALESGDHLDDVTEPGFSWPEDDEPWPKRQ